MEDEQESHSSQSSNSVNTPRSRGAPSTLTNSFYWKLISGLTYLVGGLTFPFGSIALFPVFARVIDSPNLAGWLYTVGSLGFLISDMMEWNHYRPFCFSSSIQSQQYKIGFNYMLSVVSSLCYLIGSIFFIPDTDSVKIGEVLFIVGSVVICISQAWKCHRTCMTPHIRTPMQNIKDDIGGFCMDLFSGVGGLFFIVGTILFSKAPHITDPTYLPATILFVIGSLFYFAAAVLQQRRYFFQKTDGYTAFS